MDRLEIRTGIHALMAFFSVIMLLGLAGCSGNDEETMSTDEINKLIAPVGKLNTGAPKTVESPVVAASADSAPAPADTSSAAPAPVAAPAPATPAPVAARSGKQVYDTACFACHATGAAGAPKLGDKAAWGPRIAQGMDTLVSHAINGFQGQTGVMPPKGTCAACSNDELKAAVKYMVDNSK